MKTIRNAFCLLATLGFVGTGFAAESTKSNAKPAKKNIEYCEEKSLRKVLPLTMLSDDEYYAHQR